MKKAVLSLIAIMALVTTASLPVHAQNVDMAAAGLQSLVTKLSLSDTQKAEVDALIKTYTDNAAGIREKVVALQKEMQDVELSTLDNKKIQRLSANTGRYSAQFTETTLKLQAGFYAVLTAEQRKEFDAMRAEVAERRAKALP